MQLVLLTFGDRIENHYQAYFSIISFLKSPQIKGCCIITDKPEFYKRLERVIDIIEISENILSEWRGEFDFFWRIKIKALEMAICRYPARDILYVDTDTFLVKNLDALVEGLSQGNMYMHKNEGLLNDFKSKTEHLMWKTLQGKNFQSILISEETAMWNAGVIGIPKNKALIIVDLALKICDDICRTNCPRRLVEQFAFSLALSNTGKLVACSEIIAHYWGNKLGWNSLIEAFFLDSYMKNYTLDQDIIRINTVKILTQPIVIKERKIKKKLFSLIHKLIPVKVKIYFDN